VAEKKKARNTHFRQTVKSFRAERQTQVFSKIKRNIPYRMYHFSKKLFSERLGKMKNLVSRDKLPKFSQKKRKNQ
jgi:hypothetical protein